MPQIRRNPGAKARATSTTPIADTDFTRLLGLQRHEPLDAETRAEIDLLIKAAEMGYRLAARCSRCGHWITAPSSLKRHMGASCAAKAANVDG
jgi:hypothetical protein